MMRKLFLLILFSLFSLGIAQAQENILGMAQVDDADTILINGEAVDIFAIDAPEWTQDCKLRGGKKFFPGAEARAWLKSMLYNKIVSCDVHKTRYNKKLATCYLDGKDIGELLVLNGYAFTFLEDIYEKEQKKAKAMKKGIWRGKCQEPIDWRRENK